MSKILALFTIITLSLATYAANSPIIYKTVSGTLCAYDLISKACVNAGTNGVFDTVLINGTTIASAKLVVKAATDANAVAIADSAGGSAGGIIFGAASGNTGFIQGLRADGLANVGLVIQNAPATLSLGTSGQVTTLATNALTFSSATYQNCAALTTNGSGLMGCTASDERLKRDIVPFERGLEAIEALSPKTYKFKDPSDINIEHSGFIAQNVSAVIPEAVRLNADGYMMLDYWTIVAVQANAIKELSARVKDLEAKAGAAVKAKKSIPMKALWRAPKRKDPPSMPLKRK